MIRHRVIAGLRVCDGANSPARKESWAHKLLADLARPFRLGNAGKQNLSGIGAAHAALLLVSVEGERVAVDFRAPEARIETCRKLVCLRRQALGLFCAPQALCRSRGQMLRAVGVSL